MAIFHAPEDKNKTTFAGGTLGMAKAKHEYLHKGEKEKEPKEPEKLADHLAKASEHLDHARRMTGGGAKSDSAEKDPHEVNEEVGATAGGLASLMEG